MKVLTRSQVRNLDRIAVERFGIPGIVLMENAGRGATDFLLARSSPPPGQPILVLAGKGNNGGDGFVIARHLALRGHRPEIAILGDRDRFRAPGDAGTNFRTAERMDLEIREVRDASELTPLLRDAGIVVDAILGTGLAGEVRGLARDAIEALNDAARPVFAVDIPSGLDCDTGLPLGSAVRAEATATFAAMKKGLDAPGARAYAGEVRVVDIGTPLVWE